MADPKYADLPGIAHDEPDIYETNDLPESDQTSDFYEEESEVIEKTNISPTEAFNKYKDKSLTASKVDFSEKISRNISTGYTYELVKQGENETVLQKYQRLQCEMSELLDEVQKIQSLKNEKDVNCLVSTQQIEQALKKLADLKLEDSFGSDVVSTITDPQGAQIKKLFSQLERFKAQTAELPESQGGSESGITFQLKYRPEQAHMDQINRLAELERRIHRLEVVLGASNEKLTRLSTITSKGSLLEAAQQLSATASMLDSAQLDHIEGRLTALTQKLESVAENKKQMSNDAEGDEKVQELYNIVKANENVSKILPETVERLTALKALHEKATDFATSLTQIELLQSEISSNVENNKNLLQGVQESFANNLNEINKTVMSLDRRIKEIKKH
ncbi:Dynamitin [Popillia japonica]|uniref:Dynamitin n=1 Tax=Popillia japonica TaxID=7064 RepID=A0AAW1MEW9_POPJA